MIAAVLTLQLATAAAAAAPAEPTEPAEIDWYIPSARDGKIPWNTHDPWLRAGKSKRVSLAIARDTFFSSNVAGGNQSDDYADELGLRIDGSQVGVYAGTFPGDAYVLGVSLYRHRSWQLYDAGLPDWGIGLLYPSADARVLTDGDFFVPNILLWPTGLRLVWADFVVVDARLHLPGLWVETETKVRVWSWGLSLEAGVCF